MFVNGGQKDVGGGAVVVGVGLVGSVDGSLKDFGQRVAGELVQLIVVVCAFWQSQRIGIRGTGQQVGD